MRGIGCTTIRGRTSARWKIPSATTIRQQVLLALDLKPGEVIASGYFTFPLARHVGAPGENFAVDVSPDMIRRINRRIREPE